MANSSDKSITENGDPQLAAVIDIGATSIRMAVAEIRADQSLRYIDQLSQAVSLGKDSFIKGKIERHTIEDCVRVLKIYQSKLEEYGISDPAAVRVVATSAVRESSNRLAFQDRIFIATGLEIEPFDEAELHRVTYLSVLPFLNNQLYLTSDYRLVCEIGGGTTEVIGFHKRDVLFSRTFRLGSLRLRKKIESFSASSSKARSMMESHIDKVIEQIHSSIVTDHEFDMIGMGGDLRLVVNKVLRQSVASNLVPVPINELRNLTEEVLDTPSDRLARKYHLSIPDADSFGPALLIQLKIMESLGADRIFVANANVRDGLIKEIALGRSWTDEIAEQIIRSVVALGKKYHFDEAHARHVAMLTKLLFEQLSDLHQLDGRNKILLFVAALLHEIGAFVGDRSYHKHSMYLIQQSEFFGIGVKDQLLVALIARYHRRATPQPNHEGYMTLMREDRVRITKLAAILRIAIALNSSRREHINELECQLLPGKVKLIVPKKTDLSLEQLELKQAASMFEEIFGLKVELSADS